MTISTEDQVAAINNKPVLADEAAATSNNNRLQVGKMLVSLRQQVESQGKKRWKWQEGKFSRSRKDIKKLMRLASAQTLRRPLKGPCSGRSETLAGAEPTRLQCRQ
jgi:hypothetical protein